MEVLNQMHDQIAVIKYCLMAGRLILLIISLKRIGICKCYFYYEFIVFLVDQFLPQNETMGQAYTQLLTNQTLTFIVYYYHFWPSFFLSISSVILKFLSRSIFIRI